MTGHCRGTKPAPLPQGKTDAEVQFTLQSSPWDQAVAELRLAPHLSSAPSSASPAFPTPLQCSPEGTAPAKSHAHEAPSQALLLGYLS